MGRGGFLLSLPLGPPWGRSSGRSISHVEGEAGDITTLGLSFFPLEWRAGVFPGPELRMSCSLGRG